MREICSMGFSLSAALVLSGIVLHLVYMRLAVYRVAPVESLLLIAAGAFAGVAQWVHAPSAASVAWASALVLFLLFFIYVTAVHPRTPGKPVKVQVGDTFPATTLNTPEGGLVDTGNLPGGRRGVLYVFFRGAW
ncbi:MAG: hypothetical protein HY318_04835 [Armatimonadetes bacterium]|nr:hypothetical protein [Armatimonadota bacterium]